MASAREQIESYLKKNQVFLFMKGTPEQPLCGFSARAIMILRELKCPFGSFDVLSDETIRQGVKEFGNWPTIPQLYINGELVGGSDIMMEMFESGELQELLEKTK